MIRASLISKKDSLSWWTSKRLAWDSDYF